VEICGLINENNLKGTICAWMADWSEKKKVELQSRDRGQLLALVALVKYLHNNCPHLYPDKEKGGLFYVELWLSGLFDY
jgi:hypothetical protein